MSAALHPDSLPQLKIRPEHLALAAIVYVFSELPAVLVTC